MNTSSVRRLSLGVLVLVAVALLPSCRQTEVRVRLHQRSEWKTGYEATMTLANESRKTVDGWTVEFDLPEGTSISTHWDAGMRQEAGHVTFKSLQYNAEIERGDVVEFGFTAAGHGLPTNCKLNGRACRTTPAPTTAPKPRPKTPKPPRDERASGGTTSGPSTTTTTTGVPSTTVPDAGAGVTTTVPAPPSTEVPGAAELLASVDTCETISEGRFQTDDGTAATVPVCEANGAVVFEADLDIDCDGVVTFECNETTDPSFQPDTFVRTADLQPLNAATLPYVVLPTPSSRFDYRDHDIAPGAVVAVIHQGKVEYAVFGDTGPADVIGEGSYALARNLGIDPDPLRGGADGKVTYVVFPDSKVASVGDHAAAVSVGQAEARKVIAG
jgi:hypothetical protein